MDGEYWKAGRILGIIVAFPTFIGGWWYATAEYGFLFGFGLGWLPGGILALIVYWLVVILWGPILLGLLGLFIYLRKTNQF